MHSTISPDTLPDPLNMGHLPGDLGKPASSLFLFSGSDFSVLGNVSFSVPDLIKVIAECLFCGPFEIEVQV